MSGSDSRADGALTAWQLVPIAALRLQTTFGVRAGRVLGIAVAAITSAAMVPLASSTDGGVVSMALRGVEAATWLAGGAAAIGCTTPLIKQDDTEGITDLVVLHGGDRRVLMRAQLLASIRAVLGVLIAPVLGMGILALALTSSLTDGLVRSLQVVALVPYLLLVAIILGGAARVAARLQPGRATSLLLALLFVPQLASSLWPDVPTIPGLLGDLLTGIATVGHALGATP